MSIFPATDIVADVARAADPQKAQAAYSRLSSLAGKGSSGVSPAAFAVEAAPRIAASDVRSTLSDAPAPRIQTLSPAQKFEAFLLQSWLETLLPKEESGVFGADAGANVWRSMMAEQLGAQLAGAGGLGLQKLLDSHSHTAAA
jgi:flagellar protein FlgJ